MLQHINDEWKSKVKNYNLPGDISDLSNGIALYKAAWLGMVDYVKVLLPDSYIIDDIITISNFEVTKLLVDQGVTVTEDDLISVCYDNDLPKFELLLQHRRGTPAVFYNIPGPEFVAPLLRNCDDIHLIVPDKQHPKIVLELYRCIYGNNELYLDTNYGSKYDTEVGTKVGSKHLSKFENYLVQKCLKQESKINTLKKVNEELMKDLTLYKSFHDGVQEYWAHHTQVVK